MSVYKKKWTGKNGQLRSKWMVHIKTTDPQGQRRNIRRVSPLNTRRGAEQFERQLREQLLREMSEPQKVESDPQTPTSRVCPTEHLTLQPFIEIFLREHSQVEQLRPRYIREQQRVLVQHVAPVLGEVPLQQISSQHFGQLKRALFAKNPHYSPKTINNTLGVLSRLVRFWWEHRGLDAPRLKVGLIRLDQKDAKVYQTSEYEGLVAGARDAGEQELAIVLLMGDAGLRQGELRALHRSDLSFGEHSVIRVKRTRSREGEEHPPKGKRNRSVPMTARLAEALQTHLARPQDSAFPHVFLNKGQPLTQSAVRARVRRAERCAGLEGKGRSHVMRHTFVTELADRQVPARIIQELAGHRDLKTTLRYMHVRDGQTEAAIHRLEAGHARSTIGAHEKDPGSDSLS